MKTLFSLKLSSPSVTWSVCLGWPCRYFLNPWGFWLRCLCYWVNLLACWWLRWAFECSFFLSKGFLTTFLYVIRSLCGFIELYEWNLALNFQVCLWARQFIWKLHKVSHSFTHHFLLLEACSGNLSLAHSCLPVLLSRVIPWNSERWLILIIKLFFFSALQLRGISQAENL